MRFKFFQILPNYDSNRDEMCTQELERFSGVCVHIFAANLYIASLQSEPCESIFSE